ncbi:MAG TPA: CapA family protein [Candidatus Angelobacter sp.]|nr:CapA family protein [Candidatus Angelobacter sp.]
MAAVIATIATLAACHRAPEKSADLWLGGDVNLGDAGKTQLQDIASMVQGAVGIVNLEGPVAERLPQDHLRLWNAVPALSELSALNVRVAGIANNHAGDAGADGQEQTARHLRDNGIVPAGGTAGVAFLPVNGMLVAVTEHDLTQKVPPNLEAELATARQHSDVLVASFHVTGPPSYLPRPELQRAVEIAYHAGANVIVAHGTHALGPVERRSHAVIAWGLGNVVFACDCTQEEDAMLLRVTVQRDKAVSAEVLPLRAGIDNRRAEPASEANAIFDLLEAIGSSKLSRQENRASF